MSSLPIIFGANTRVVSWENSPSVLPAAVGQHRVQFTPTVQHCSMATLIGLSLRVKLMQTLPNRFKVCPTNALGSYSSELHASHLFLTCLD